MKKYNVYYEKGNHKGSFTIKGNESNITKLISDYLLNDYERKYM